VQRRPIAIDSSVIPAELIREDSGDNPSRLLFRELRRLGHVDGRDLMVERYSAEGHPERLLALAREVVLHAPELIVAGGGPVHKPASRLQRRSRSSRSSRTRSGVD